MKHLLAAVAALLVGSWLPAAALAQTNFTGTVVETKDVDAYTYVRLKAADGEIWAAVTKAPVKAGSVVTVANAMVMSNFESRSLKRTFDRILFGSLGATPAGAKPSTLASLAAPAAAPAMPGAGTAPAAGMPAPKAAAPAPDVKVPKATGPNARTVAEVITKRLELKGKQAVVRGRVVKYNGGIMGSNWVHVRDGSGSAQDETNDLLVKTKDVTKVGDTVVVTGTVRADVDLGSGYSYQVLIDDAKIGK